MDIEFITDQWSAKAFKGTVVLNQTRLLETSIPLFTWNYVYSPFKSKDFLKVPKFNKQRRQVNL